jgi:hypothetical protein
MLKPADRQSHLSPTISRATPVPGDKGGVRLLKRPLQRRDIGRRHHPVSHDPRGFSHQTAVPSHERAASHETATGSCAGSGVAAKHGGIPGPNLVGSIEFTLARERSMLVREGSDRRALNEVSQDPQLLSTAHTSSLLPAPGNPRNRLKPRVWSIRSTVHPLPPHIFRDRPSTLRRRNDPSHPLRGSHPCSEPTPAPYPLGHR